MSNTLKLRADTYEAMKHILSNENRSEGDLAKYEALETKYSELTKTLEAEARFDIIKNKMGEALDTRAVHAAKKSMGEEEYRSAFINWAKTGDVTELRADALNRYSNSDGLVNVPTLVYSTIQRTIAELSAIRRAGVKVIQTTSTTTLPIVGSGVTAGFTNETASYSVGNPSFAQITLGAYKASALCKVSEELLQDASTDLESTLAAEIGTAFANLDERALISGSASGPTGLIQSTGTIGGTSVLEQNLGSSTGSALLDNMIAAYYKMQGARRTSGNAVWIVGDALASQMRQLKSVAGTGQYMWEMSAQAGVPDKFLGLNVINSSFLPAAWPSTGGFAGCLLYTPHFVIGDRGGIQMQRLNELYSETGLIGWRAFKRFDGALTSGQSLVKLKANVA